MTRRRRSRTSMSPAPQCTWARLFRGPAGGGARQFPLLAVNVPSVRLRANCWSRRGDVCLARLRQLCPLMARLWRRRRALPAPGIQSDHRSNRLRSRTGRALQSDIATKVALDWDHLLNGRKTGVVFIEAERANGLFESKPRLGTQALIQLTDFGLVWKSAAGDLDAFVFSQSTGLPAAALPCGCSTMKIKCCKRAEPTPAAWRI